MAYNGHGTRVRGGNKKSGQTWVCPSCKKTSSDPIKNSQGLPYCGACHGKFKKIFIMRERDYREVRRTNAKYGKS